jgi:NTP pyrophosphatase (non-canonical NTP hydrolase)
MNLNRYQIEAQTTALYPGKGENIYYPALGLNGEAGEVADKIKKVYRDDNGKLNPKTSEAIAMELGDVLWYIADLSYELGYSLETIAYMNLNKLKERMENGKIGGSGDDR